MRILVLCTGNSARSQMAEGFLRAFDPRLEVCSAGTDPAPQVNPHAVDVMREAGIDISGNKPKSVEQFLDQAFDAVITVCAEADRNCPVFHGHVGCRIHMGFTDPARATGTDREISAEFRRVRDLIKAMLSDYYEKELRNHL